MQNERTVTVTGKAGYVDAFAVSEASFDTQAAAETSAKRMMQNSTNFVRIFIRRDKWICQTVNGNLRTFLPSGYNVTA